MNCNPAGGGKELVVEGLDEGGTVVACSLDPVLHDAISAQDTETRRILEVARCFIWN
jgi:hypothetical protein